MAAKCPKCSTELLDDYGMVTCPKCAAIVFVDMEGFAHVASEAAPEAGSETGPESVSERVPEVLPEDPLFGGAPLEPLPSSDSDMNAFLGYAEKDSSGDSDLLPEMIPGTPVGSASGTEPGDFGQSAELDLHAMPSQNDPNDPLGLSAYANSEMSSASHGPLVVSLIISGIDAKDLRDEIRQALQDPRFGWDAAELLSKMNGGVLRIDRISPVKATVVINRIKNLSVRIRWEQNAITEIDPLERDP